jgi:hypothetical protein
MELCDDAVLRLFIASAVTGMEEITDDSET